ncbi:hypothetical protein EVG20_g2277 [Dentipellis fragilis]|uniref:Cytochrome P450 n=1 Tax=Dentipellis fragilis TaxID=205917 RepID=A0A4Y9ZA87_9AGAM|nr:hypothetical protein EVG20_g2277 [Dentipellis fragilis]
MESLQHNLPRPWALSLAACAISIIAIARVFTPPAALRHLPKVPILPLLWSYFRGEVEDVRIKRLIVPFANERNEGVVLVYAFGRWIVHVLDHKIARDLSADIATWPKEVPPDDMLLWRFVGRTNVILANGKSWQRHSRVVKSALDRNVPIADFVGLGYKLFNVMGEGGRLLWDDLTMRFTLDAVGTTTFGHDFNAIADVNSPFVRKYNGVMDGIASPLYIIFPKLERWVPRPKVIAKIDEMVLLFTHLLEEKKQNAGNDMLTYMLEDPEMSDTEFRDNMVVFFIAGHDTTAGAMSSLVYYLARNPDMQVRAREEVLSAMGQKDPTLENMRQMPFTQACIREALRINTPITYMVPRSSPRPTLMSGSNGKTYALPANTSVILNICAIHYNDSYWPDPYQFNPERFFGKTEKDQTRVDASLWLPFALGPRQCPARNFAMYELRTLASMLLQRWEWTLPNDSPHSKAPQNGFSPFALSLPKNMDVVFKKRE